MNDADRDKILMQIHKDVSDIRPKVEQDHRELNGNGQPGLIKDFTELKTEFNHQEKYLDTLEKRISVCEAKCTQHDRDIAVSKGKLSVGVALIAFIVNLLLALAGLYIGVFK